MPGSRAVHNPGALAANRQHRGPHVKQRDPGPCEINWDARQRFGLVVVLFIALLYVGSAREDPFLVWNKTYGVEGGHALEVIPSGDGGFVIYGRTKTSAIHSNLYLLKVDGEGRRVWERTYSRMTSDGTIIGEPYQFTSQALTESDDGGYVAIARISPKPTHDLDYYFDMYLLKVDANGEKVWEKIYKAEKGVDASSIIGCTDGGFMITGNIDDYYRDGFYVMKIDSHGEKLWDQAYFSSRSWAGPITETMDGSYMILGGDEVGYYVVKIDSEGEIIQRNRLQTVPKAYFRTIVRNGEGFILAGHAREDMGEWNRMNLLLLGLDRHGNKTWERIYRKERHLEALDILPSGDGFIVVGEYAQPEQPWGHAYFLRIDDCGNEIWETTIPYCEEARAMAGAGNAEFVFVSEGQSLGPEGDYTQDIYVARIRDTQQHTVPELPIAALITALMGGIASRGTREANIG